MAIISTYVSPDELYQIDKMASIQGKTRYQILKEWIMKELADDPKQRKIQPANSVSDDQSRRITHAKSENSETEPIKSEQQETSQLESTTPKSTTPPTHDTLKAIMSSEAST